MQKIKLLTLSITFALALASCNKTETTKETTTNVVSDTTKAKAVAYECPMKCAGSKSDKPGKCPTCKMDLVEVK